MFWNIICCSKFLLYWPIETWKLRAIYAPVIVYCFDVITDLNILVLWFELAKENNDNINGKINMKTMAGASLGILLSYRLISAVSVFVASRDHPIRDSILQFFDFYIFLEVYRSHIQRHPTDNLRWIQELEATLESSPQILLQIIYLTKIGQTNYLLVLLSLTLSLTTLVFCVSYEDGHYMVSKANHYNRYFVIRFTFRLTEILSHEIIYVLLFIVLPESIFVIILLLLILHHAFLFLGGCLGREPYAFIAYMLFIPKLNKTLSEGKRMPWLKQSWKGFTLNTFKNCCQSIEHNQFQMNTRSLTPNHSYIPQHFLN